MFYVTELGSRLKEARLSKGYSLDDLQEITKIQKRYLIGIEEGNYSIMPGTFYVRAFIKQYADAVGLDADEILEEFRKDLPAQQATEEVAQSFTQSPTRRKLQRSSSSKMMESAPKFIVALFIIVIIVAIWFLYQQKVSNNVPDEVKEGNSEVEIEQKTPPTGEDKTPPADTTEPKEETPVEEPEEEEPVQELSAGAIQPDGVTTNYELSGTDKMNIRVEVTGDTWVGIRNEAGAEQVTAQTYSAGAVVEHDSTANGYARIRLGNALNAKVFVNDVELPYAQNITTQNIVIILQEEEQ